MKNFDILFIYSTKSSWVYKDLEIVKKSFLVKEMFFNRRRYLESLWIGFKNVFQAKVLFVWFGSLFFLPLILFSKLLGKKVIVVAGGYDVAKTHQFKHGTFDKTFLHKTLGRLLFYLVDDVLCVSQFNKKEAIDNAWVSESKITVAYLGFNKVDQLSIKSWDEREKSILMISSMDEMRYYLKGGDSFCRLANLMPDYKFYIIGELGQSAIKKIESQRIKNLEMLGHIEFNSERFNSIICNCRYVTQLSIYESFGAALIDGAIRGCYPIASNNTALKELVAGYGMCVQPDEPSKIKESIEQISADSKEIAAYFSSKFSIETRERKIKDLLYKYI